MKITIPKKIFSEAVHIVSRFSERKNTTLPALSSILIIASEGEIKMRATNLEIGVDLKIEGEIKNDGVVAVPATLLQQIASSLTNEGTITLEHTGSIISLTSGSGKSSIKTAQYEDFPSIPFPESVKNRVVIPGTLVKTILSSVSSCASTSTIRPELSSIYVSIEGGILTAVATDSFRLVEKKASLLNKGTQGKLLIPARNAMEIAQVLPDDDIILSFDDHQCAFVSTQGMFVSRLTNTTYPDYKQIIPKESVAEAVVLRKDFEIALKQTTIFSDTFQKIRLSFDLKKNQLAFFAKNADVGESSETLSAHVSGEAIELSFNHKYLTAVLALTSAESVSLTAAGIGRPLTIKGVGDNSLVYIVSPMNQ
jgi:DNA polymerase III subunit beta